MRPEFVSSASDPSLAPFREVADPERLRELGVFVAEGRRVVAAVLADERYEVTDILLSESAAEALGARLDDLPDDVSVVVVRGPRVLRDVTGYRFHQGCLALVQLPDSRDLEDLPELYADGPRLVVALERVTDPDNVGTIFRSAAAFGADAVLLSRGCAHPFYRKALRTSIGTVLDLPFAQPASLETALLRLRRAGYTLLALTPSADAEALDERVAALPEPRRVVMMLGSEEEGLEAGTLALADAQVRIPLADRVDSLNVAAAAAIALYGVRAV